MATVMRALHPALHSCLAAPMVAYDMVLPVDAVHVGVPSTAATVIIAVDEPLDVGWLHEPSQSTAHWCSISGLHLRPALIHTHGLQRGIHLAVTRSDAEHSSARRSALWQNTPSIWPTCREG